MQLPADTAEMPIAGSDRLADRQIARWLLIIGVVTFVTRLPQLGNPVAHIDDQFYLYIGQSILAGDLPYVDIWDRKPIGLYLIYAACAALGPYPVIQYQLVAGLFVFATACVIFALGRRVSTDRGAFWGALLYPLFILPIGGQGGQAPVFYNLLIATAALLTLKSITSKEPARWWPALAAMMLCGIALTIKQTTIFEGVFFGLFLVYARYKSGAGRTALFMVALVATAALPTGLFFLAYWLNGHFADMWHATVISVLQKMPVSWEDRFFWLPQLTKVMLLPFAVALCGLAGLIRSSGWTRVSAFLVGWCLACAIGFLAVPNFFDHYALPLAVPLCVAMAIAFSLPALGRPLLGAILVTMIALAVQIPYFLKAHRWDYHLLAKDVRAEKGNGCLYVYFGPPQLYVDAHACRVTKYAFPDHLDTEIERYSLPDRPEDELQRIFTQSPPTLVTMGKRYFLQRNLDGEAVVQHYLDCAYRPIGAYAMGPKDTVYLWKRRPESEISCSDFPMSGR